MCHSKQGRGSLNVKKKKDGKQIFIELFFELETI